MQTVATVHICWPEMEHQFILSSSVLYMWIAACVYRTVYPVQYLAVYV